MHSVLRRTHAVSAAAKPSTFGISFLSISRRTKSKHHLCSSNSTTTTTSTITTPPPTAIITTADANESNNKNKNNNNNNSAANSTTGIAGGNKLVRSSSTTTMEQHFTKVRTSASSYYPVVQPPWTCEEGKQIEGRFRRAMKEFHLLGDDQEQQGNNNSTSGVKNIGIALSGGKDSLTLLYMLKAVSGRGFPEFNVHAFNVSGKYSCGSMIQLDYLKGICKAMDVPFHVLKSSDKVQENLECYSCSRERRTLLFNAAREHGCTTLAFGHHQDDNAQTLLMNLFQKGEVKGMLPKLHMLRYGVTIIRPFIYVAENDIRQFARHYGFARVTCQCPVGANSRRKQVDQLIDELQSDMFTEVDVKANLSRAALLYGSDKSTRVRVNKKSSMAATTTTTTTASSDVIPIVTMTTTTTTRTSSTNNSDSDEDEDIQIEI